MTEKPKIITVGVDDRDWPRSTWGSRDRAREAERQQERARLGKMEPLPVEAAKVGVPESDAASNARRLHSAANRAPEDAGIRPRPGW